MRSTKNTTRLLWWLVIITIVLASGYAVRSILTSVSSQQLSRTGMQAVYPVRVELQGLSRAASNRSAVTRVSPTGQESDTQHWYAGTGNEWREDNQYFKSLRVYLSSRAYDELTGVVIDAGSRRVRTGHPQGSELWRPIQEPGTTLPKDLERLVDPEATAFEFTPNPDFQPWSVLPVVADAFNYMGDIRLGLWSLLWAVLIVAPTALSVWLQKARRSGAEVRRTVGRPLLHIAVVVITAATLLRFADPSRTLAVSLGFFEVSAMAASISLLVFVVFLRDGGEDDDYLGDSRLIESHRYELWLVIAIAAVGLTLRVLNLDALMRSDMYNLAAGFSLHETGEYAYPRNKDLTHIVAAIANRLGPTVEASKIPFIMAGTITIPLVYIVGRFISPAVGALAAILFALGPNHIAVAGHVREYSINLLIAMLMTAVQFAVFKHYWQKRIGFLPILVSVSALMFAAVFFYSRTASNVTVLATLQSSFLVLIALSLHFVSRHFPRLLKPLLAMTVLSLLAGLGVVHEFGPFSEGLVLEWDFFLSYLNPLAEKTMQTFSFAGVSTLFVLALLTIPFISSRRSPYFDAAVLAFWGTFLLYSLKLEAGGSDRYLYHVAAFHTLLLSGGLLWLLQSLRLSISPKGVNWIPVLLLFAVIVNPINSFQSALGTVPNGNDPRRPSGSSGGDYYREVADFMRAQGVTTSSAVVDATGRPYLVSLALDRPFTRQWESSLGRTYDLGEGVYAMRVSKHDADQSAEALRSTSNGFLITDKYRLVPPNDFRFGDIRFKHLGSMADPYRPTSGFLLHEWELIGADTPSFEPLLTPIQKIRPNLSRDDLFR